MSKGVVNYRPLMTTYEFIKENPDYGYVKYHSKVKLECCPDGKRKLVSAPRYLGFSNNRIELDTMCDGCEVPHAIIATLLNTPEHKADLEEEQKIMSQIKRDKKSPGDLEWDEIDGYKGGD